MCANFFSNQDSELPSLQLKLPKIKQALPKIRVSSDADFLFEIDGKMIEINSDASSKSNLNFHS